MCRFLSAMIFGVGMLLSCCSKATSEKVIWFNGLEVVALNSKPIETAKWRDRPALLQFWASWCQSCSGLMQELDEIQQKYPPLLYLAISVDSSLEDAKKVEHRQSTAPQIFDEGKSWAQKFDVQSVPTIVVIDADGLLRFRHTGHLDAVTALRLNQVLTALTAEAPKDFANVRESN